MEGSVVGIWCAHGEGQAKFPDDAVRASVLQQGLAPIRCWSLFLPPFSVTLHGCMPWCMMFIARVPAVANKVASSRQ